MAVMVDDLPLSHLNIMLVILFQPYFVKLGVAPTSNIKIFHGDAIQGLTQNELHMYVGATFRLEATTPVPVERVGGVDYGVPQTLLLKEPSTVSLDTTSDTSWPLAIGCCWWVQIHVSSSS